VLKFSLHEVLIFFFHLGSVCCQTNESAIGWGQSAMKLTSTVFSALKNIGGSFVAVEDGTLLSTSQSGTVANCSGSELAEEAVLKDCTKQSPRETDAGVDSIPVVKLDLADVSPLPVAVSTNQDMFHDDIIQQFPAHVCFQGSADLSLDSFSASSESGGQTLEDKWTGDDDNNIVFSSGTRRKVRQTKQPKGEKNFSMLNIHR